MNLPNALTVGRIFLVPLLVVVLLTKFEGRLILGMRKELVGAAIFGIASLTDVLDGYLARRRQQITTLGQVIDPLADKLLIMTVFVEAAWLGLVPWWLTAAVVARDVMIGLGALIFRLWFGPLHGRPTRFSKVNTAAQLLYVALMMLNAAFRVPPEEVLDALAWLTLLTTVLSGLHYLQMFTRRAWTQPPRTA